MIAIVGTQQRGRLEAHCFGLDPTPERSRLRAVIPRTMSSAR